MWAAVGLPACQDTQQWTVESGASLSFTQGLEGRVSLNLETHP